ncbi:MAG TPA: metal-dependent hydrolase [Micromonosporaceae bacterium]
MMGPSHALSGAAGWLAGSLALDRFAGYDQSPMTVAVGTAVCAGAALFPDLDLSGRVTRNRGGATVARTFGVASLFVAEVIEKLSLIIYTATRTAADPHRTNGHRTFTHTVPFAALAGAGATALCTRYGKWAVIGVLFVMIGLALRGLFDGWARRAGWVTVTLLSALGALLTFLHLPGDRGYPMVGLAVGAGCLVHVFGDLLTRHGAPIFWPVRVGGRRWRMIGIPDRFALRAGGVLEVIVLRGVFTIVATLAATVLLAPAVLLSFAP